MKNDRIEALRMLAASGQQGSKSAAINECLDEIQRLRKRKERATGPSLHDVMVYAEKIGMNGSAEEFFDHYESVGWVYGKSRHPIVKWEAACRRWHRQSKIPADGKKTRYGVG